MELGQTISGLTLAGVLSFFFSQHAITRAFVVLTALTAVYILLSAWTGMRKRRISLPDHLHRVATWSPERYPSIDVFLPSAGEPLEVLNNTFAHVARLRWGGPLRVLVLDDSARTSVARLAETYGFDYKLRPDRGHLKKAGNLRYGLHETDGDFIAIFDADFCPRADFLDELLPYFDEPDVGIVQSPRYVATHGRMNWLQSAAGSVQEIFYRWVQPSRDAIGGAICVGTCAVYRRDALARSGGFAQIEHSKDVHTGLNLIHAGFSTRYVPVVVSAGLCPDNLSGFLAQQYRWCAGAITSLADTTFAADHVTFAQRLCFLTGFLYYVSTAALFFGGPLAAAALIWFLPEQIWPWLYLPLIASAWLMFLAWKSELHSRWNLAAIRVMLLYSAAHALAIYHALRGRTMAWVPTGSATKGASLSQKIQRLCFGWLAVVEVVSWAGVLRGVAEYGLERFWLAVLLTAFATVIVWPLARPLAVSGSSGQMTVRTGARLGTWGWMSASMAMLVVLGLMLTGLITVPEQII